MILTLKRNFFYCAGALFLAAFVFSCVPCRADTSGEPLHISSQVDKAQQLLDGGRPRDAVDALDAIGEMGRNYYRVSLLRSQALAALGRLDEALDDAYRAAALEPANRFVLFNQASILVQLRRVSEALPILDRVIREDPHFAAAYYYRGFAFTIMDRPEFADADFERALMYAGDGERWIRTQVAGIQSGGAPAVPAAPSAPVMAAIPSAPAPQLSRGKPTMSRAEPSLQSVESAPPQTGNDYLDKLRDLYVSGDFAAAAALTDAQLAQSPDDPELLFNRAVLLQRAGDIDTALRAYETAAAADPANAEIFVAYGTALEQNDDIEAGIEMYERAIELNPMLATAYINLGGAFIDQGDYESAGRTFRSAIERDPNYMLFNYGLLTALVGGDDMQAAADVLEQRFNAKPIDVAALPETDYVDYALITLITADPSANFNFALMLADYGYLDDAATFFHLFVQTYPGMFPDQEYVARAFLEQFPAPQPEK